jgi:hypothetical protein
MKPSLIHVRHRLAALRVRDRNSAQPAASELVKWLNQEGAVVRRPSQPSESSLKTLVEALDDVVGELFAQLHSLQEAIEVRAGGEIVLKTGAASITLKKDGRIHIQGKDITIDGSGKVNINASGDVVMKGNKIIQD